MKAVAESQETCSFLAFHKDETLAKNFVTFYTNLESLSIKHIFAKSF